MTKLRYGADEIKHITLFESMTRARVVDFLIEDGSYCFVVDSGDMGLAIGKKGANIEKIRKALGKPVIVFEHDTDDEKFIKNMLHPVEVHGISVAKTTGEKAAMVQVARQDRAKAIGPKGVRIKLIRSLIKRHNGIDNLSIRAV